MKIFLTFDYELFFGSNSGTLEKSIIEPTERLLKILNSYDIKATFFVDAGYLIKLNQFCDEHEVLKRDLKIVTSQIKSLCGEGHSVQLHIHPHWEDAVYAGGKWLFKCNRFTLNAFSAEEVDRIVGDYKKVLEELTNSPVFAYRAGGWCIQPFSHLKKAFEKHNIWLDSTVFKGGYYNSETHMFDYRHAPDKDFWVFSDDILQEESGGMVELPISSYKVSPMFYWQLALIRLFKMKKHKIYGDGSPIGAGKKDIFKLLIRSSYSVASVDGFKISYLQESLNFNVDKGHKNFVAIGHPKAFSRYSLSIFDKFCNENYRTHGFSIISGKEFYR
ncbi:polysaccharide deacetylase family protein [Vibrio sp. SBT000027]|uniref:polysaccharide deacetylase family protein n=1 Tax=Vibrio sp. SBT000027 TaxID=1803384 RepID=UPI000EF501A9|nr:polysaccharide deacetylase family protein [Vibrio sp. SBT000027]RLQ15603.1 hypothetical protein AYK60_10310 [Vibrio sp. SBT000027]